jgi:mercuric ion binding protein
MFRHLLLLAAFAAPLAHAAPRTLVLNIPTMDCATCPLTIKAALLKVPGVTQAKVSYERREAVIKFDDSKAGVAELKEATASAGYPGMIKSGPT